MRVVLLPDPSFVPRGCVLCVGTFDGVHRGHQALISLARERAARMGLEVGVLTFSPHPRSVLRQGDGYERVLTPPVEKERWFAKYGVDVLYVCRFDREFASQSTDAFVKNVLLPCAPTTVIVGYNFTFGAGGKGTTGELSSLCGAFGVDVIVVEPVEEEGRGISSSRIRDALCEGDVEAASRLLGRPYEIAGEIAHGDARGSRIGFPTANVEPQGNFVLPHPGVYATTMYIEGRGDFPGVTNVGFRPTFDGQTGIRVESHLFDFHDDVYGLQVVLRFEHFLREEKKFASIDDLVAQIREDASQARAWLEARTSVPPGQG